MNRFRDGLFFGRSVILPAMLALCLPVHGNEGSGNKPFVEPVDAATLRDAMVTGSAAGDHARYWECHVGDGSVVLHYRLLADGSGIEAVSGNPELTSTFQWQTESATTASSTVDGTGARNELTRIGFLDSERMNLLIADQVKVGCVRQGNSGTSQDADAASANDETSASQPKQALDRVDSAVVSEQNRPVASYTYLEKRNVGFPAMLVHTAKVAYSFANGYTVFCANWDPRELNPTPDSVGQSIDGCEVKKQAPEKGRNKSFKKGQTIDISFGNVSASGTDLGGSTSSRISGSSLRMTPEGQIAIGKFNAFTVSSGGNGAGGGNRKRVVTGRYALDGHLITIVTESGETLVGFVSWGSDSGSDQIDHVFVNGEHFWDRSD